MCSVSSHLALSRRQDAWWAQRAADGADLQSATDIPGDADTWMAPDTGQYSITEYLLARATGGRVALVDVPLHPVGRMGVPLLRDLRHEGPDAGTGV
ncbi:hypothetical protein H4R21_006905, partial [Coemansia helicoidea]